MKKSGLLLGCLFLAMGLLTGCEKGGSANGPDISGMTKGDFTSKENLVYQGYKPSDYINIAEFEGINLNVLKIAEELSDTDKELALSEFLEAYDKESDDITDRGAEAGDYVDIYYTATQNGIVVDECTDEPYTVALGEDEEPAALIEALYGCKAGDQVTAEAPAGEEDENNASIIYEITVERIFNYIPAQINDELIRENGCENEEQLLNQIYENYLKETNDSNSQLAIEDALRAVAEESEVISYPDALYDSVKAQLDDNYMSFFGMSMADFYEEYYGGESEAYIDEEIGVVLVQELAAEAVAEKLGLIITKADLDAYKETIYKEIGYESLEDLEADNSDEVLARYLLTQTVGGYIVSKANKTEVAPSEYYGDEAEVEEVYEEDFYGEDGYEDDGNEEISIDLDEESVIEITE